MFDTYVDCSLCGGSHLVGQDCLTHMDCGLCGGSHPFGDECPLAICGCNVGSIVPQRHHKPSNPKDVLGTNRAPFDLVSDIAIAEESLAMAEGGLKYGKFNYRAIGVRASIYLDAARRHIAKWKNGEERDQKTGVHHLGSARACLGILLEAQGMGNLTDDRPPVMPGFSGQVDALEERMSHLVTLYGDRNPRHYAQDTQESR